MRIGRIKGRNHHIIIVAEGYGSAQEVADQIHEATGIDTALPSSATFSAAALRPPWTVSWRPAWATQRYAL